MKTAVVSVVVVSALGFGQAPGVPPPPASMTQSAQLWWAVRTALRGPGGPEYFESNIKDAAFPRMRGTVVTAKYSPQSDGVLTVRPDGQGDGEIKLILASPVKTFFRVGDVVQFEGVPKSFTQKPFQVTFDVRVIGVPAPKEKSKDASPK